MQIKPIFPRLRPIWWGFVKSQQSLDDKNQLTTYEVKPPALRSTACCAVKPIVENLADCLKLIIGAAGFPLIVFHWCAFNMIYAPAGT